MAYRLTVREQKAVFAKMKELFNNTCVRCEGKSGLVNLERDHIKPRYQGGDDSVKNMQPLCAKCNSSKGAESIDWRVIYAEKHNIKIPQEWLKD